MAPLYPAWDHELYQTYLQRFDLHQGKKIKELSRGMRMKLMLAVALSHDAKLLILDEPTSGLDVLARDELMDILADYVADGEHGVLFSTHISADLERSADFIAYINGGLLYYTGPKDEFEDTFRIVKGGPNERADVITNTSIGLRRYETGFDALVSVDRLSHIDMQRLQVERASIDDVIRLTNANARGYTILGNSGNGKEER